MVRISTDEEVGDASDRDDSGQPSDAIAGLAKEAGQRGTVRIPVSRKIDADDQQILGHVSGVLTLRADETLGEEHGANEQHQGSGDLRGDQEILQAVAGKARLVPSDERRCRIGLRGDERGHRSGDHDDRQPAEKRDRERRAVEGDVLHSGKRFRSVQQ